MFKLSLQKLEARETPSAIGSDPLPPTYPQEPPPSVPPAQPAPAPIQTGPTNPYQPPV